MTSNLTYKEIIDYLDRYSTDPMIRRLLEYIDDKEENVIEGLVEVGMDPVDYRIEGEHGYSLPGPLIEELRGEVSYLRRESDEWQEKYIDMKDERDRLKARSVADLLAELNDQIKRAETAAKEADRKASYLQKRNAELEDKINVWTILEK